MAGEVSFSNKNKYSRFVPRSDCLKRSCSRKCLLFDPPERVPPLPPPPNIRKYLEYLLERGRRERLDRGFDKSFSLPREKNWPREREKERDGRRLGAKGMREWRTCARRMLMMHLSALINGPLITRNGPIRRRMALFLVCRVQPL